MTTGLDGHAGVCGSALIAVALAFGAGSIAFAHGTHETACFSGYELSPGVDAGNGLTEGATFAGIDNPAQDGGLHPAPCDHWTTNGNGGTWTAKIDRVGVAGIGSKVDVVGGRWFWFDGDDRFHFGRVLPGGFVQWPGSLDAEIVGSGCGPGVAQFNITLSVLGHFSAGSFVGCLDDIHLDPRQQPFVFPQRIWGTLHLN